MRRSGARAFTLTEVLVATTISALLLFGIVTVEMARLNLSAQNKEDAGINDPDRALAGVATLHIGKRLEQADRVRIINGGAGIQLRRPTMKVGGCQNGIPDPSCFDNPANYEWDQYSMRSGGRLTFFEDGCGSPTQLTNRDIGFTVSLTNSNVVNYAVTWTHPQTGVTMRFPGEVTIRAGTTSLGTGLEAPGANLPLPPTCS